MRKKVGIAFGDFVTEEKKSRRGVSSYHFSEILGIIPFFLLIIVFALILLRLFYLQVLRSSYYKELSDNNRTRTKLISAPRGIILDRYNRPFISNSSLFKTNENGKIKRLDRNDALNLLSKGKNVENDILRDYLYKEAFAHVVGYVGQISKEEAELPSFSEYGISDVVGKSGLEEEYESMLHGTNGKELFEVDSRGLNVRTLGKKDPIEGKDLLTTLDLDVGLAVAVAMRDVKKGAVIVSDPRSGAIFALFSKPTFDPNVFTYTKDYVPAGEYKTREEILTDSQNQPLLNRAIAGEYPPGSTFKLISAAAALEKGAIKPSTKIEDTGILRIGDFSFGNWYFLQYGRKEGALDVVGAIKRSNDIFFYKASENAGVESISSMAKTFGLGERLGIDLIGESKGFVPSPKWKEEELSEKWYLGDTYNYGIGQGYLLTTPLQVNMWTIFFSNGGTIYSPHLIKSKEKVVKKNFVKKEYINLVRKGMNESCETGGVAWPFFNFRVKNDKLKLDNLDYFEEASGGAKFTKIKVACKTGTSEVGGKDTLPHAWITVFAPYNNPEITVTVLVENGGEGSSVAGPIARDILKAYFERK